MHENKKNKKLIPVPSKNCLLKLTGSLLYSHTFLFLYITKKKFQAIFYHYFSSEKVICSDQKNHLIRLTGKSHLKVLNGKSHLIGLTIRKSPDCADHKKVTLLCWPEESHVIVLNIRNSPDCEDHKKVTWLGWREESHLIGLTRRKSPDWADEKKVTWLCWP